MPDLSDSINWSEVDANNNQAPPNGWPEGMMPSGVNDAARADRGALKRFWDKANPVRQITPSGALWTFTTANPAYPTDYVEGEVYCFRPNVPALGGDQFQVNALPPKPIWKHAQFGITGIVPVVAHDFRNSDVQLVYNASLNAGAGAFILRNPFVPINGDGVGGATIPGGGLTVAGTLSATGYTSRSGISGPSQANVFNIQWNGTQAHLWIDGTDEGPIVTGSAGNIVIGGNISVSGDITVGGTLHGNNFSLDSTGLNAINMHLFGGANIAGGVQVGANVYGPGYDLDPTGLTVTNIHNTGTLTVDGAASVAAGSISGNLSVGGSATLGSLNVTGSGAINSLTISSLYFNPAQQVLSSTAPPPGARILYLP